MYRLMRRLRSMAVENALVFTAVLFLTVLPLAWLYLQDTRDNLVDILSAKLTVASERGAELLDAEAVARITNPNYLFTPEFDNAVSTLRRLQEDFDVDNAVLYRWDEAKEKFVYIADGFGQFVIGSPVHIHDDFPATHRAARQTWQSGAVGDTRLFQSGESMFFQVNLPLKVDGEVAAVLMLNDDATRVAEEIGKQQQYIVIAVSTILLVGILTFLTLTTWRMRPLLRLTDAARQIAAGNLEVAVPPRAVKNEIGQLNETFRIMVEDLRANRAQIEEYSRTLERRVAERTRQIRNLLDNMDEGIFTITAEGRIDPGYSSATAKLLGERPEERNFIDTVTPGEAQRRDFRDTFALLLGPDPVMGWDDMVENLPREFQSGDGRWFRARYRPVYDEGGEQISRIMVILQDITREKTLQTDIEENRARQEMLINALQNRETFDLFYQDTLEALAGARRQVAGMDTVKRGAVDGLFRTMHTIKGTSALFGMNTVSGRAHGLEDHLRELSAQRDEPMPGEAREALLAGIDDIEARLKEQCATVRQLTGEDESGGVTYTLSEEKIDRITGEVLARVDPAAAETLRPVLARLKHIPAQRLLKKYQGLVRQTAERLGKSARLEIADGEATELSRALFKDIDPVLLHLVRNALDHGVEDPDTRAAHGKAPEARIVITAQEPDPGHLLIEIADDGRGIDVEKLEHAGIERGFLYPEEAAAMPRNALLRLLFTPGFSTKADVTDLSGRGVGLDVVRSDIEELGGRVRLTTHKGRGTTFTLQFPTHN